MQDINNRDRSVSSIIHYESDAGGVWTRDTYH